MTAFDATGIHALGQFADRLSKAGKALLLCGARDQPSRLISGSDLQKRVGTENVLPHVWAALTRAREVQGDFAGIGWELAGLGSMGSGSIWNDLDTPLSRGRSTDE